VRLLAHGILFALAGWVVLQLVDAREAQNILLWFVLAIVLHDLVLLPFYSALDRLGRRLPVPPNAVRIPVVLSGLLLLLFFPMILGRTGLDSEGYLERWLLVTAALFAGSLAITVLHLTKKRRVAA
jgi:uncharacterized membrane protein